MKAKKKALSAALCSLLVASTLSLSACSSLLGSSKIESASAFGPLTLTSAEYQQEYENSSADESFKALTLLTRSQINDGSFDAAKNTLGLMTSQAKTPAQHDSASLVSAMLSYKTGDIKKANEKLSGIDYNHMQKNELTYFLALNSLVNSGMYKNTHDAKYQITAFKSESALFNYLNKASDKKKVLLKSVDLLKQLDDRTLSSAFMNVKNTQDKGYYEYAIIDKSSNQELKQQMMSTFENKYPDHPLLFLNAPEQEESVEAAEKPSTANASTLSPVSVGSNAVFTLNDGDKIAVLLPLSGRFARIVGEPAKLGILTALKDRNSRSQVIFYDTNKKNISSIVNTISSDGTKLVIGPVLKPEVNALNSSGFKLPSIVFNAPEGNRPVNQWYFDLGPNYEGTIVAAKMHADGYTKPAVISLSSDSASQRSVASFTSAFANVHKNVTTCSYSDAGNIAASVSACPLADADAVYVNASASDAVTIKAALPSSLQVYLTDKSYLGVNNTSQELALNGAIMGDMPWMLTDSPLKKSFMDIMPKANSQVQRIFAASYDAVNLAFSITNLAADGNDVLHGLSGDISLGNNGLIESTPMWVKLGNLR